VIDQPASACRSPTETKRDALSQTLEHPDSTRVFSTLMASKECYLGSFDSEAEAGDIYDKAALQLGRCAARAGGGAPVAGKRWSKYRGVTDLPGKDRWQVYIKGTKASTQQLSWPGSASPECAVAVLQDRTKVSTNAKRRPGKQREGG
jgi:hypothetical protein